MLNRYIFTYIFNVELLYIYLYLTQGSNCQADMYRAAQIAEASPNGNATIGFSQKYRPENETKNMNILKELH